MHIEILVEDSSGAALLECLVPKIIGPLGEPHRWRIHPYKGVGRLPRGLKPESDPSKRILLDQLPRLITGLGRTPGVDWIVVVVDADRRDCHTLVSELKQVAIEASPSARVLFRVAIEEIEAWYLGDRSAIISAYPRSKIAILEKYIQDSVCDTWELMADVLHLGGSPAMKVAGYQAVGHVKHGWARTIGPRMQPDENVSPSFVKFRDGLRRIVAVENA